MYKWLRTRERRFLKQRRKNMNCGEMNCWYYIKQLQHIKNVQTKREKMRRWLWMSLSMDQLLYGIRDRYNKMHLEVKRHWLSLLVYKLNVKYCQFIILNCSVCLAVRAESIFLKCVFSFSVYSSILTLSMVNAAKYMLHSTCLMG